MRCQTACWSSVARVSIVITAAPTRHQPPALMVTGICDSIRPYPMPPPSSSTSAIAQGSSRSAIRNPGTNPAPAMADANGQQSHRQQHKASEGQHHCQQGQRDAEPRPALAPGCHQAGGQVGRHRDAHDVDGHARCQVGRNQQHQGRDGAGERTVKAAPRLAFQSTAALPAFDTSSRQAGRSALDSSAVLAGDQHRAFILNGALDR